MRIVEGETRRTLVLASVAMWSLLAILLFLAPDPVWIQRCFTAVFAARAFGCVVDMVTGWGLSTQTLPSETVEMAGLRLARGYFLFFLGLATASEGLIARASAGPWVVCLGVLPLVIWVVKRTLTNLIVMNATETG